MSEKYPDLIQSVEQLDELLSEPTPGVVKTVGALKGDFLVLGAGGKMGPSLTRMIRRASDQAKVKRRVIGVDRAFAPFVQKGFDDNNIETIACDLLQSDQLAKLPDVPNIVYMAAMKFGSSGQEALTWAMNVYLPATVCQKFRKSRIVAFSSGNIYGLVPSDGTGSTEADTLNPMGDYATSVVGRERMFEHFSRTLNISVSIVRLNYAVELRYGVLFDLAQKVNTGEEIDLSMGHVNVIWQGDANAATIQALGKAASPPFLINVAGPEFLKVREVCEQYGKLMGKSPKFTGKETGTAFLANGTPGHKLFGEPRVSVARLLPWIAEWVKRGGPSLGKPTHFETRNGKF